ncbi:tetratricopeptide repeat protein [Hymenobacter terrestris]|uniref:Tetratricopeptide repeat protein n=1 Tax=Hymenobacter terrestris TaxID=2748310 RepID=A0ABX2PYS7_9BACT|nr:tetratricopeptide repeat protein [Hymenobacter terrestris]NVO83842.1 tetratricopeptide repeat protein [Hymenobacter terrestris]
MLRILFLCLLLVGTTTQAQSIETLYQQGNHAAIVRNAATAKKLSGAEAYMVGCAYFQIEQDELAVNYFDMALAKGVKTGPVYFKKGLALRFAKRFSEALTAFDEALMIEPKNTEYQAEKGLVYYQAGEYDLALSYFRQLQQQPRASPTTLYMIPHILHLQQHYTLELSGFYAATTLIPPKHPRYLETLADIGKLEYSFTGDYRKAATTYARAIELFPEEFELTSKLLKALNAAGQYKRADSVFVAFQRLYKQNKLPAEITKSGTVAVAEFHWQKQLMTVHRSLDEPLEILAVAYRAYLITPAGDKVERWFTVERTLPLNGGATYLLCELGRTSGTHHTYPYGWKPIDLSVAAIFEGISLVLDGKMEPSASSDPR